MYTWILDPGHGMLTAGKRSPKIPPGILEYEFNRDIAARVLQRCEQYKIDAVVLNPGPIDVPEEHKINYANEIHRTQKNCIYVAIHANAAAEPGWSDANGSVVFHCPGSEKGQQLALEISAGLEYYSGLENRGIKAKKFNILKNTSMPAVLVECGFMTNMHDAADMASDIGRDRIAHGIFSAIFDSEREE